MGFGRCSRSTWAQVVVEKPEEEEEDLIIVSVTPVPWSESSDCRFVLRCLILFPKHHCRGVEGSSTFKAT